MRMESEIVVVRPAAMADGIILARVVLDFESEFVFKARIEEGLEEITAEFQKVRLPKRDRIAFQSVAPEVLEAYVRRNDVLVATIDNRIVGYLCLDADAGLSCLRLCQGGVQPDQRRKGVGSALAASAEMIAKKRGLRRITVAIQAKNEPAIAFIRKQGYVPGGYEEFYFPNLEIALFYSKMIR